MTEDATIAAQAAATAHRLRDRAAVVWRVGDDGRWQSQSWRELAGAWRLGALGLEAAGVAAGETVAVVARGHDIVAREQAVLAAGATSIVLDDHGAVLGQDAVDRLTRAGARWCMTRSLAETDRERLAGAGIAPVAWDEVVATGASIDADQPDRFEKLVDRVAPETVATIEVVDGGSVGRTHEELVWAARSFDRLVAPGPDVERDDHTVALLDPATVLGRTVSVYWPSVSGATVWWPDGTDAATAIHEAQPTAVIAPSGAWRVVAEHAVAHANERWVALGRLAAAGEPIGRATRFTRVALDRVFRRHVARRAGLDRCTAAFVAGSLDATTARELAAVGIGVRATWSHPSAGGLVTACRPGGPDNSSGVPVPGATVRVGAAGIEVRSPGSRTWVTTGVPGRLDSGGRLCLT